MGYLVGVSVYFPPLEQNHFYHIYNRGNNRDEIFFLEKNYIFFLERFLKYLGQYVNVYAYCLLRNHFHFLIRVKNFKDLPGEITFIRKGSKELTDPREIISEQFRRLFVSYSKAVTKQENRNGSVFQKNFQRKQVDSKTYLTGLVKYIHRNPENHKIFPDYKTYAYSSFQTIATLNTKTFIRTEEVISWFGDVETFIKNHNENQQIGDESEFAEGASFFI